MDVIIHHDQRAAPARAQEEMACCARLPRGCWPEYSSQNRPQLIQFENLFQLDDLLVLDDVTLHCLVGNEACDLNAERLACAAQGASAQVHQHIFRNLPADKREAFDSALRRERSQEEVCAARHELLNQLFWELTYWKTPELYEELIDGERLHPGIFQQLAPDIRGRIVLDAGAGSGRASLECLRYGARKVYAVEPSPGLLYILRDKRAALCEPARLEVRRGRFDALPCEDRSVDLAISCSAFTAEAARGGEAGLAEMERVTRPGGKIVIIWPRRQDYAWLAAHGFHYVALPVQEDMRVCFRSMQSALRCARRFYARNREVECYLLRTGKPEVPFSVLHINPPIDYCWLLVA